MRLFIYFLFFISGTCALIYQVAWTRVMTHIFGTTVYAVSIVLTAFMAGLALGSYFLGKYGDRSKNLLKLYGIYEIGIGLTALLSLQVMDLLPPLYLLIHQSVGSIPAVYTLTRFLIAFVVLILPTILMGATLPILSRYVIRHRLGVGKSLSSLYSINTFGAVCGSLLAGFFLIKQIGVHNSVYLAVSLNVFVGGIAFLLSRRESGRPVQPVALQEKPGEKEKKPALEPLRPNQLRLVLWAFALSGFTSFAYEVYWTRSLVFLFGNSTYAFVTMLAAFLTGIALGGYCIRFIVDRLKRPFLVFAWVEVLIGLFSALAMPLLIHLVYSELTYALFRAVSDCWELKMLLLFGISLAVMLVPTVLIGATFPLVGKICVRNLEQTGKEVGKVYAINTLGNILGGFIPGLLILPWLGINKSILLMAALNIGIGAVILLSRFRTISRVNAVVTVTLLMLVLASLTIPLDFQFPSDTQRVNDKVLFYEEGVAGTCKVYLNRSTGEKNIGVDGVNIGGTNAYVDQKQQILAHLPKLLLAEYRNELSVGLGSGVLIGECAKHQSLETITCVEIAPSVVRGAAFFAEENHGVLQDARVRIVVDDGVNYLRTSNDRYDIISSDAKSKPEYGGNGVFFSKEYYTLVHDHLSDHGLMIQWIPTHYPLDDYRMIVKTFTSVFPHATLWYFPGDHGFLIGSKRPLELDYRKIQTKFDRYGDAFEGIIKYGVDSADALLSLLVTDREGLTGITEGIKENSFDRPYIEFYSFEQYSIPANTREANNLDWLLPLRKGRNDWAWLKNLPPDGKAGLENFDAALGLYLEGLLRLKQGRGDAYLWFRRALVQAPDAELIRYQLYSMQYEQAKRHFYRGEFLEANTAVLEALKHSRKQAAAHYLYGVVLAKLENTQEAIEELELAIRLDNQFLKARKELALLYEKTQRINKAIRQWRTVIEVDDEDIQALVCLGRLLADPLKQFTEAFSHLDRAYALNPKRPATLDALAWALYQSGDKERAKSIVEEGGSYHEVNPEFSRRRARILE